MGSLWLPAVLGRRQMGWGHLGAWGVSLDMCTHTCMHAHTQNAKINMLGNCKWPPPWRQPCLSCLTCMHVCAHVYVCTHVHVCACMCVRVCTCVGVPPPNPHPPNHPPNHPPPGLVPPKSVKMQYDLNESRYCNSVWRFGICGDFHTHGWVFSLMGGLVGGWVSGSKYVKSLKI